MFSRAISSSLQQAFTSGFHAAFIVCASIAAIGVLTSLVRGKEKAAKEKSMGAD
jgi:hypothetical protein